MIELDKKNVKPDDRHSSKGNQLKWREDEFWYKADYTGYEGLAEYTVSNLLRYSDLESREYVLYETEEIGYRDQIFKGCRSKNFLRAGWQLITLERLFYLKFGESLYKSIYQIPDCKKRLRFLVDETEKITGLENFGQYMCKLLTIDAVFLNEDRHTHNIAVLWDGDREFDYCPIFDQGAALLADTAIDYPLKGDVTEMMTRAKSKTFCQSFDEQLALAEELYGEQLHFSFRGKEVKEILEQDKIYSEEEKKRVYTILLQQRRKYQYLFC